ncbi:DNA primase [Patescibacteria group bacterium]|nr:DNA primase [Patescibacteria group bacterium]
MADLVDEIKAKLDVVAVISQYLPLKKAGANYKALSPFTSEKTPSFMVSPQKQIWHCFSTGKGGDIFTFIEELEGVNFAEALQILADRAGLKMDDYRKKNNVANKSEKDEYFKAHELAAEFFEKQLYSTNDGKKVLEYLHRRGLDDEILKEFRVGFAPDRYDVLNPMLLDKGISKTVLLQSGLASTKNIGDERIYDKFRGRLMFPIFDYFGRICGFGGRALNKDQMPKYLNSAENLIYNKSKVLYGLSHAKLAIKEQKSVVLVEGYFDVLVPYQNGIKNVVATSGTALTQDHVRLIKRLTENVYTSFDTDEAGFKATRRAFDLLIGQDISVKTLAGLDEKDPADYVLEHGGEAYKKCVDEAIDFVDFYIGSLAKKHDVATFSGRKFLMDEVLPILKPLSDAKRMIYVDKLASVLGIKSDLLFSELQNLKLPNDHPARQTDDNAVISAKKLDLDEIALGIVLYRPDLFEGLLEFLNEKDFSQEYKGIYKELTAQYNLARENLQAWNFEKGVLADNKAKLDVLSLYAEDRYSLFTSEILKEELEKLVDKMRKNRKTQTLKGIQSEIKMAEEQGDMEKVKLLQMQYLENF